MSKKRPKWGKQSIRRREDGVLSIINYITLIDASRSYLKATNRYRKEIDLRLQQDAKLLYGVLTHFFHITKSYILEIKEKILANQEEFEKEVKKFSDSIISDKSVLVTNNLEKEMETILNRDKAVKGKGRVII